MEYALYKDLGVALIPPVLRGRKAVRLSCRESERESRWHVLCGREVWRERRIPESVTLLTRDGDDIVDATAVIALPFYHAFT